MVADSRSTKRKRINDDIEQFSDNLFVFTNTQRRPKKRRKEVRECCDITVQVTDVMASWFGYVDCWIPAAQNQYCYANSSRKEEFVATVGKKEKFVTKRGAVRSSKR